jgi:8-oxo-dGTP diphosphatase
VTSGDGWTRCVLGHRHWGRYGAAGLLLVAPDASGVASVLLQHRAAWSHHGDTWGVPGGARDAGESAVEAALREAYEETGVDLEQVTVLREVEDDHGDWSYTTVVSQADTLLPVTLADAESTALAWVPLGQVGDRALHPGFAASWPSHLSALDSARRLSGTG